MCLVSKSEFARKAGVSPQAVDQKIKKGHIDLVGEGRKAKIDIESEKACQYLNDLNDNRERAHRDKKGNTLDKPKKDKQQAEKKVISNAEKNIEVPVKTDQTILEGVPETLQEMSKYDLDRMKAAVTIQKEKLKHDKERQLVIDRAVIHKAFNELYQIDREELLQASSHLSPRICQDVFGTNDPEKMTKTTEILDAEFYKIQGHVQKVFDKYLDQWAPISE